MIDPAKLPDRPYGMRAELASAFVGLSPSAFLKLVRNGTAPQPRRFAPGAPVWSRRALKAWIDGQEPAAIRAITEADEIEAGSAELDRILAKPSPAAAPAPRARQNRQVR